MYSPFFIPQHGGKRPAVQPQTIDSEVLYGNTAQFGKKPQPGFLAQFKVWKTKEYSMYFSFFKLKKWGKKTAAARRHNCAVLPYGYLPFLLPSGPH